MQHGESTVGLGQGWEVEGGKRQGRDSFRKHWKKGHLQILTMWPWITNYSKNSWSVVKRRTIPFDLTLFSGLRECERNCQIQHV